MKKLLVLVGCMALTGAAMAENASCSAQATDKKLAGAAKTSFMKKCEQGSSATCEMQAKEKKLAGAAKKSFETKCMKDADG